MALGSGMVLALAALTAAGIAARDPAPPPYSIRVQARLLLWVDPMCVRDGESTSLGTRSIEVDPVSGGRVDFEIPWPAPDRESRLTLEASGRPGAGDDHTISLEASLSLPDGRSLQASRTLRLYDGATSLFEVAGEDDTRLVLVLRAESMSRPVLVRGIQTGPPVRVHLEVERVDGGQTIALETNRLDTFMGEGVEYSFQRGAGEGMESVQLLIKPLRLEGEAVEIEVEITATLPGDPTRVVLSRRQRLVTTRGARSSVSVTAGDPPAGYRFALTPDF